MYIPVTKNNNIINLKLQLQFHNPYSIHIHAFLKRF